jgi:hypothetical protein
MVAVLDTTYYDPKQRRWVDYSIAEMAQLMSLPAVFERDRQKGKEFLWSLPYISIFIITSTLQW